MNFLVHGFNSIMSICDILVSGRPCRLMHFYHPLVVILANIAFSSIYWAAGGLNYDGSSYIYPVLNWDNLSLTVPFAWLSVYSSHCPSSTLSCGHCTNLGTTCYAAGSKEKPWVNRYLMAKTTQYTNYSLTVRCVQCHLLGGGRSERKRTLLYSFIYPILNWENLSLTVPFVLVGLTIGLPLVHGVIWSLHVLRDRVIQCARKFDEQNDYYQSRWNPAFVLDETGGDNSAIVIKA